MSGVAEFIRELSGWRGAAALIRLDGKHFVVSSVDAFGSGPETLVFESDDKGEPTSWLDVAGGRGLSREEAVADLERIYADATEGGAS